MAEGIDFAQFYNAHVSQRPFHLSRSRYKLIGGAMGGGKSKSLCAEGIFLSIDVPKNRGAIIRKNFTTLKRTTHVTFMETCPPQLIANITEKRMRFINGSEILFLDADETKDALFDKLKSLELGWFAIDEASEVPRKAFQILASRLRLKAAEGHYYGLLASNPELCWLKEDFIDRRKPDHEYFPALPKDNPFLPADYIPNLRAIFDDNQQKKYIDGDWNVTDDPMQMIPFSMLKNCIVSDDELKAATGEEYLGIDVAELGDDKTVFAYFRNAALYELEIFSKLRTDQVSDIAKTRIIERKINADQVGVDAVGNGAGVWGNLTGADLLVNRVIAGESPVPGIFDQSFANLKAEMWWALRQDVLNPDSGLKIPNRQSLIQDLTAPRYKIASERKIEVESKESVRKRIGRSTDEGDAVVIGNWMRHLKASGAGSYNFGMI